MPAADILFLPGMMCDRRLWEPQIAALGIEAHIGDMTTADNFARLADGVLAGAPDRFALAGLSMGGILAFEIWRRAPERVTHLALLDTNPYAESPERQTLRLGQIDAVASGKLEDVVINSLKPLYLAASHRDDRALLDTVLKMATDAGPETFQRQSLALKNRVDSVATLPTIDCPTLVMCGDEDRLCPVALHELMAARIPGAELQVLEDCGHLATLEQPRLVTAALEKLIAH